jgi:hypothetical protein
MPKGGYRPNSGPAKGTKYKPRTPKQKGETKAKQKKTRVIKAVSDNIPSLSPEDAKQASGLNLTPLDFMLKVMRDPTEDNNRRDKMAALAAPFCHPRKGEGLGKKEEKESKAKTAGAGRFSASQPPLKVVK